MAAKEHEDLILNASGGIGGKSDVFLRFIAGDALYQADRPNGDQVLLIDGLGVVFLDNMRHQPHIPFHQNIPRIQVALGAAGEVDLLLLRAEGLGEAPGVSREMQGQKKTAAQQQHGSCQHIEPSFFLPYAVQDCPYSHFPLSCFCAMIEGEVS